MRNTMSKIAILTDSSCDIPQELAEKYGIDIMGFHILLDDEDIVEMSSMSPSTAPVLPPTTTLSWRRGCCGRSARNTT